MNLVLLVGLALLDGGFAGFRASAGRSSSIAKWSTGYYPRWIRRGLGVTALLLVVVAAAGLGVGLAFGVPALQLAAGLNAAAAPLALGLSAYAGVVMLSFLPWTLAGVELRTLISVTVFGPLTLARPLVIGAALLLGLLRGPPLEVAVVLALGCAAALVVEPLLGRAARRGAELP